MGVPALRSDEEEQPHRFLPTTYLAAYALKDKHKCIMFRLYNQEVVHVFLVPSSTCSHILSRYLVIHCHPYLVSCSSSQAPQPHMHVRWKGTWERQPTSKDTSLEPFPYLGPPR